MVLKDIDIHFDLLPIPKVFGMAFGKGMMGLVLVAQTPIQEVKHLGYIASCCGVSHYLTGK